MRTEIKYLLRLGDNLKPQTNHFGIYEQNKCLYEYKRDAMIPNKGDIVSFGNVNAEVIGIYRYVMDNKIVVHLLFMLDHDDLEVKEMLEKDGFKRVDK